MLDAAPKRHDAAADPQRIDDKGGDKEDPLPRYVVVGRQEGLDAEDYGKKDPVCGLFAQYPQKAGYSEHDTGRGKISQQSAGVEAETLDRFFWIYVDLCAVASVSQIVDPAFDPLWVPGVGWQISGFGPRQVQVEQQGGQKGALPGSAGAAGRARDWLARATRHSRTRES